MQVGRPQITYTPTNNTRLETLKSALNTRLQTDPNKAVTQKAVVKESGFFSKTQKVSVKAITDMDTRLNSIDAKMKSLGMQPPERKSASFMGKLKIFGEVALNLIKKLPVVVVDTVKSLAKTVSYVGQGLAGYYTHPTLP